MERKTVNKRYFFKNVDNHSLLPLKNIGNVIKYTL